MSQLVCGNKRLNLEHVQIMGILNTTPDSFSDGGSLYVNEQMNLDLLLQKAEALVQQGASILDIGGESTRPGAKPVSLAQEQDRVLPAVEKIARNLDVVISVDTSSPELMLAADKLGAGMINDIRALTREGALEAAAQTEMAVCLMHMQGSPAGMQDSPQYTDVLTEVMHFLHQRVLACVQGGVSKERLILDPGFGFGKQLEHNLQLLNRLEQLKVEGLPLLVGTSRKSMIGQVLGREVDQRLPGTLATVAVAVMQGAKIIRVHDVAEAYDVARMTETIMHEKELADV